MEEAGTKYRTMAAMNPAMEDMEDGSPATPPQPPPPPPPPPPPSATVRTSETDTPPTDSLSAMRLQDATINGPTGRATVGAPAPLRNRLSGERRAAAAADDDEAELVGEMVLTSRSFASSSASTPLARSPASGLGAVEAAGSAAAERQERQRRLPQNPSAPYAPRHTTTKVAVKYEVRATRPCDCDQHGSTA